jgi:hypothetical protein
VSLSFKTVYDSPSAFRTASISNPARILEWQYEEGLFRSGQKQSATASNPNFAELLLRKGNKDVVEWRAEYARRLALFIVSRDAGMSEEHLRKLFQKWEQ